MRILVKRTGALGDVLEATAIVARLRAENPDAQINVATAYPQVFAGNPHVSEPHLYHDRVIDLDGAFERAMRKLHPIDAYSQVAFGDMATPHRLEFRPDFPNVIPESYVGLHPARSWPIRTLPREWWQKLADAFHKKGRKVIVTGTYQDWPLSGVIDLRTKLSLAQQDGLIASASCFICSESGPMILAQTTQTPIIALLTMVPPEHVIHDDCNFNYIRAKVPCVGCAVRQPAETTYFDCELGTRACLEAFDVEEVVAMCERITA